MRQSRATAQKLFFNCVWRQNLRIHLCLLGKKGYFFLQGFIGDLNLDEVELSVEVGRDKEVYRDYADEIFLLAKEKSIHAIERKIDFDYLGHDFVFAAGWRWLLKGVPSNKLIVVHDSLLPKYRGFSPLFNALINREPYVGVTALFGSEKYDKGDIIAQSKINVNYPIKTSEAIDKVSELYKEIAYTILGYIKNNCIPSYPQDESEATYSCWLDDADYYINWCDFAEEIVHKIHLLGPPYSYAKTTLSGSVVYLLGAELIKEVSLERIDYGKVLMVDEGCPIVIAKDGLVKLTNIVDEENLSVLPIKKFRSRFGHDSF